LAETLSEQEKSSSEASAVSGDSGEEEENSEEEEEETKLDDFEKNATDYEKKQLKFHELMLNGTCVPNRVDEIKYIEDNNSWWSPVHPKTWFCFSLRSKDKNCKGYQEGEMITFSYGKRSNASMLTFYGFCSVGNRYDSIKLLLNK
jgi:hypothetical protein